MKKLSFTFIFDGEIEVPIESSSSSSEDTTPSPQKNETGSPLKTTVAKQPEPVIPKGPPPKVKASRKAPSKASTVKKSTDKEREKERSKERERHTGSRRNSRHRDDHRDHHRDHRDKNSSGQQRSGLLEEFYLQRPERRSVQSQRDIPRSSDYHRVQRRDTPRGSNAQPLSGSTPQGDKLNIDRATQEIDNAIALRPEFLHARENDTRRAARIFVTNGILSLSELRQTPKRNRDFLIEDLRKTGIPSRS